MDAYTIRSESPILMLFVYRLGIDPIPAVHTKEHEMMDNQLYMKISVRLFTDDKCFGPGIASLLNRVETYRSLRKAAASMGMAYSKAWTILKSCEEHLGFKLLNSTVGGKNGGGATLTDEAEQMLAAYDAYCLELKTFADKLLEEKFSFYSELQRNKV